MPGAELKADLWVYEYFSPYDVYCHGVSAVLVQKRTAYQEMAIVETGVYGKGLVLDGKWQSCTGDEFLYHEPLVHPACVAQGGPRRVLVLGGGEGATVREALKWKTVEKVVMVDIDGEVVEACKRHLPEMHQGAFEDPRTEVVIGDALDYLEGSAGRWDVIISDLSDPIESGPSRALFTKEYFGKCGRALAAGGCFVVQAGPVSPPAVEAHARLHQTVRAVFGHAASYSGPVPTYPGPWSFILGSDEPVEGMPDAAAVDRLLAEKTTGAFRMFDGRALVGLMSLPRHVREALARGGEAYTLEKPPTFFGSGVAKR